MQIQIIGGGALGLLLTGRLVGAGNEVTLWVRTLTGSCTRNKGCYCN